MPASISSVTVGDNYTDAATIPLSRIIGVVNGVVTTNPVIAQLGKLDKANQPRWDSSEIPLGIGTFGFSSQVYGIRFRNATTGANAVVTATAFYVDDAVPFTSPANGGQIGGTGIQQITTSDGRITVTNSFGPVTDLSFLTLNFEGFLDTSAYSLGGSILGMPINNTTPQAGDPIILLTLTVPLIAGNTIKMRINNRDSVNRSFHNQGFLMRLDTGAKESFISSATTSVTAESFTNLPFVRNSGSVLLDLTNPLSPVVINSATYAMTFQAVYSSTP